MNRLKKILIVAVIVLCTGCDIKYSVSVQKANISENIEVSNLKFNSNNVLMSPVELIFQQRIYNYRYNDEKLFADQSFVSLQNYVDESLLYYFIPDGIIINGDNVSINLATNNQISEYISSFDDIDSLELSLYIPYYVKRHNASKVTNNTYTWVIDNLEEANIKIDFDLSKSYKYKNNIISLFIIVGFFVIIVSIVIYFVIKNKKVNDI